MVMDDWLCRVPNNVCCFIKGSQMDYYVMVSFWCESLLTNTRCATVYDGIFKVHPTFG